MTDCIADSLQSSTQASCAIKYAPSSNFATSPHPLISRFSNCSTPHANVLLPLLLPLLLSAATAAAGAAGGGDVSTCTPARSACDINSAAVLISGNDSRADLRVGPKAHARVSSVSALLFWGLEGASVVTSMPTRQWSQEQYLCSTYTQIVSNEFTFCVMFVIYRN